MRHSIMGHAIGAQARAFENVWQTAMLMRAPELMALNSVLRFCEAEERYFTTSWINYSLTARQGSGGQASPRHSPYGSRVPLLKVRSWQRSSSSLVPRHRRQS